MLAEDLDYVVGVDPHRDRHALAVVAAQTGALVFEATIAASAAGYRQALKLAERHARGRRVWAVEGSGSYGAGLARSLAAAGEQVLEVSRLRRERRGQAKTDRLDALRAARSVLAQSRPARPRGGPGQDGLRALLVARESALNARTAALCQLRALVVTAPDPLRSKLQGLTRARLLARCQRLRPSRDEHATRLALRTLASRIQQLSQEERTLKRAIEQQLQQQAPSLLDQPGVGPISAARLLLAWSHPDRIHSEAAFARLAGAAPIPASSGNRHRHRLDRAGDRQLNRALHTIITNRRRTDPTTNTYIQRRQHEGKTTREATRCLKRYLARNLYRHLQATTTAT